MEFTTTYRLKRYNDCIALKPCNPKDMALFDKLIATGKETFTGIFKTPVNSHSDLQRRTVWKLVECIYIAMNNEPPTKNEKEALYEDLKEQCAYKRISRIDHEKKVPIGLSDPESTMETTAYLIQNLIDYLASCCDIKNSAMWTDVRQAIHEWDEWRWNQKKDPLDESQITEDEWRQMHPISEASCEGGLIEKAHIVSRGADAKDIEEPWNWMALTHEEHIGVQHQNGWEELTKRFPHIRGKIERARNIAEKLNRLNNE